MLAVADLAFDERRRWPRLDASCNALIRLSASLTFPCQIQNLSMRAAQVACDARYALLVHPRGGLVGPAEARAFDVSIAFPVNGAVRGFAARGRAVYCEGIANSSRMLLGLEFVNLELGARQLLANYLGNVRG